MMGWMAWSRLLSKQRKSQRLKRSIIMGPNWIWARTVEAYRRGGFRILTSTFIGGTRGTGA